MEWKDMGELIAMVIVILFLGGKYILDYTEKGSKLFGQMRDKKSQRRQEDMKKSFESKEFKEATKQVISEVVDPLEEELKDQNIKQTRAEILLIYNAYCVDQEIPREVYASYCDLYDDYVRHGGNSYVKGIIDPEIRSWKKV